MSGFPSPGSAPRRNRLVVFGLAMVVLGWAALVVDLLASDAALRAGSLVAVLSLKGDIATLAEMLVATGLGLSILGGLREGFGALNSFFDAVLTRSAAPRPAPMPEPDDEDDDLAAMHQAAGTYGPTSHAPPSSAGDRAVAPAPGRNFVILSDGSVEVDTLLGTRIFASMEEARDFIR